MRRGLDRRSRWDQTELLQLVELVEVDASLGDLSVLDAEKLDAVADHFLVSRCDRARRALSRGRVRALHDDLLDDPGTADELAANLHLVVRKRLKPSHREFGRVLAVGGLEATRRVELDVVSVKGIQSLLVVGVHRGYEAVGCLFDFRHCLLLGVSAKRKGQVGYCHRRPATARVSLPSPQSRNNGHHTTKWLRGRANIWGSNAPDFCPSLRLLPSYTHRRLTCADCS